MALFIFRFVFDVSFRHIFKTHHRLEIFAGGPLRTIVMVTASQQQYKCIGLKRQDAAENLSMDDRRMQSREGAPKTNMEFK